MQLANNALFLLPNLSLTKGDIKMKVHKVFNVWHDMSTDGRPCGIYKLRTVGSREVAEKVANKDWGSWGQKGHVEEQTIIAFETVEEAEEARQKEMEEAKISLDNQKKIN